MIVFHDGAGGIVSEMFVSTDGRRSCPRGVFGSTMGAYPRGTGSNPVEGNGHFFPHAARSVFLFLWHIHTGSVLSQAIWFRHDGDCTLFVLHSENPSLCGRPSPCHSGDCAYNATVNKHVCVCQAGLIGHKCQTGKTMQVHFADFLSWPAESILYSKCRYSPSSKTVAFEFGQLIMLDGNQFRVAISRCGRVFNWTAWLWYSRESNLQQHTRIIPLSLSSWLLWRRWPPL